MEREILELPPLCTFLKLYFDYAYLFCLSPFRFIKGKDNSRLIVQSWLPQKVLCATFHLVSLLLLIRDLYSKVIQPPEAYVGHPAKYFHLVDSVFNLAYKFTLIKRFWLNRKQFCDLMEFIETQPSLRTTKFAFFRKVHAHVVLFFYTFVGFASLVAGKNFVSSLNDWTPSAWYRKLVAYGRKTFFIDFIIGMGETDDDISVLEIALAIFTAAGLLTRFLLGFFIDTCILIMTATLWTASFSFIKTIHFDPYEKWTAEYQPKHFLAAKNEMQWLGITKVNQANKPSPSIPSLSLTNGKERWRSIYNHFDAVRELSKLINEAMGTLVVWFILEALMYYSVNMDAFLITKDLFKRSYLLAYYLGTVSIFAMAAHITKTLETIKIWLADDGERTVIPDQDLKLILHEMTEKEIGIRGVGAFTITYTLFASFVGTVVTFFIICLDQPK